MIARLVFAAACQIWLFSEALGQAPGDADRGRVVFERCRACHDLAEARHRVGPSLYNLFGSVIGANDYNYSDALLSSGLLWDAVTIDVWTEDPRALIDGTKMAFPGIKAANERSDLIAYLRQATGPEPAISAREYWAASGSYGGHVGPILRRYCSGCHGHEDRLPSQRVSGLLLATLDEVLLGGINGPVVVPGDPGSSRIMRFLEGTSHFTTVTPHEQLAIRDWIAQGATEYSGSYFTNSLTLRNVTLERGGFVTCVFKGPGGFAHLSVTDAETGLVRHIDWRRVSQAGQAEWEVPALGPEARNVNVRLRVTLDEHEQTGEEVTSNSEPDTIGTLFVFSEEAIPQSVMREYRAVNGIVENPVKMTDNVAATFSFWLDRESNVTLQVWSESQENEQSLYTNKLENLPAGVVDIEWDVKDKNKEALRTGSYVYRVDAAPVDAVHPPIYSVVQFKVQDW